MAVWLDVREIVQITVPAEKQIFLSPQVRHVTFRRAVRRDITRHAATATQVQWRMFMWEVLKAMEQSSDTLMVNRSISEQTH